jgi:hypothetical protein
MQIERITGKLLFEHNCVIVPGLGGFVANPSGATVHPGRHTFSPPYKAVLFNRSLTANDGLLVNAVAIELKMSYNDALQAIGVFAKAALNSLSQKGKVVFPDLGYLQADIEGNIYFTQDTTTNYLLEAFGLDEFQSLPVVNAERATVRTTVKTDRGPQVPLTKARSGRVNRRLVVGGSMLAVLLAAVSFIVNMGVGQNPDMAGFTLWNNSEPVQTGMAWPVYEVKYIITKPIALVDSMLTDSVTVVEPTAIDLPVVENIIKTGRKYYVVAGCFEEYGNAQKYVDVLKGDGVNSFIADKNNTKLYKVYLASFDKMSDAKTYMSGLADSLSSSVWIYTEK